MTERLMLLDTASLYFRAFYGVPDSLKAADGTPVNAVRGLLDIISRLVTDYEPTQLVACWDDDWRPAWRVELIPSYKAHRVVEVVVEAADIEETPDPLVVQIPLIREVLDLLGIAVVGAAEHEADDVIGSLATQADVPVDVVTGDRDLFQLVDDAHDVRVIYTARGMSRLEVLTEASVVAKYAVLPQQYADFAALRGDASDGLPGVKGIGEKTAANLLRDFADLDGIRAAAADPAVPLSAAMRARITEAAAYLDVAPKVVEVVRDLPIEPFDAAIRPLDAERRAAFDRFAEQWNLGGAAQIAQDIVAAITSRMPIVLALIGVITFVLLFALTGSLVLPVKALALNVLSLSAAFGALVWIFQDGNLGALGTTPTGTLEATVPVLMFCVAFGLSMDYEVFLLARIREYWLASPQRRTDSDESVALGLARTGRVVTAAALIMAIAFAALIAAQVSFMRIFGLGLTLAVLVDATLVRMALLPAFMHVMGRWNWWAPAPLARLHERLGLSEEPPERPPAEPLARVGG